MSKGSKAPKPPDPEKVAAAQTASNRATAITQAGLNSQNQITPYGSSTWRQVGTWPDGTPRFEETVAFSPEQQGLYEQQTGLANQYNTIAGNQLGRVEDTLSSPFDLNAAANDQFSDIARQRLDPMWAERRQTQEADLAARGVLPGSEAYDRAFRNFDQSQNDAYNQMFLTGRGQAVQEALTQRNQPLSEINLLRGGGQPQYPQFGQTPNTGVSGTDIAGLTMQDYQNRLGQWQGQQNQQNALWGNIAKMAGTAIGGWAQSDPRLKDDFGVVGEAGGLPVHAFAYKGEPRGIMRLGFMADEVAAVKPGAVRKGPRGIMQVNYPMAVS